jgi:hypothetical protein
MEVAKLIMRRATPPWVRKLPARMKKGIGQHQPDQQREDDAGAAEHGYCPKCGRDTQ